MTTENRYCLRRIMNQEEQEALHNFLQDIECLDDLNVWTSKLNLFDVLKISRNEIRHSNFLAWLLNPNENHGLGDKYLKGLLSRILKNSNKKNDVLNILLSDFYSFNVYREWKNIDILILSDKEKLAVIIENKVTSNEHDNQLNRYKKTLEIEYPDYKKIFLYLTPDGLEPSDSDWDILTYTDVVEILENIKNKNNLLPDVTLLMNNYIDVIRRDIVQDQNLVEICNKIYNKHKKALDLIYEYRFDNKNIAEEIRKTLAILAKEGKIIYNPNDGNNTYIPFYTEKMSDYLPNLVDETGSWNDKHVYRFWLSPGDKIRGVFELGGLNLPETTFNNMKKLISITRPKYKREAFKFNILLSRFYDLEDNYDTETINGVVRKIVHDLLKWEDDVFKKI